MKRIAPGYYTDGRFEVIYAEAPASWWYWKDTQSGAGGDDVFPTKREALEALAEWKETR